jgi:hypothetical protein
MEDNTSVLMDWRLDQVHLKSWPGSGLKNVAEFVLPRFWNQKSKIPSGEFPDLRINLLIDGRYT